MNYVLVIDETKKQLDPCHPSVARKLLKNQKAAVFRRYPFTIILKKIVDNQPQPIELKIDPGSKTTGLALVSNKDKVIWGAELTHRGNQIKSDLDNRRTIRRNRRNRKTRYRSCRNHNRIRVKGWLPPSLEHRVLTTITWVKRLMKVCSVKVIFQELVRFDTQQLQNPEIDGVEYQQGTLLGYEVREYLLEKWSRQCSYCGIKEVPLQIEHIKPKSKGGSNRVSNLCLACKKCNKKKGTLAIEEFLKNKPELLKTILHIVKKPL